MSFGDTIKGTQLPAIPLKEMTAADDSKFSTENPIYATPKSGRSAADSTGSDSPYLMINRIVISNVSSMVLDETGIIPRIKVIFKEASGALNGPNFPKNDPVMSVYIKTQSEKFKPIRCDFILTSLKCVSDSIDNEANRATGGSEYVATGELYVPRLYDNSSRSYIGTSKEALTRVAKDSGLGFAENDSNPQDSMTWINPNRDNFSFIKEIASHAYQNDDTFFNVFIDKCYYLNYINVIQQLRDGQSLNSTYDNTVDSSALSGSVLAKDRVSVEESTESVIPILLTNKEESKGRPEYIINYRPVGNAGEILKKKGYEKRIYYYDHTLEEGDKFTNFNAKPIKPPMQSAGTGLEPIDEDLKGNTNKIMAGIDYGNNHREWNAAKMINDHNNRELQKVGLIVETHGTAFQIIRGAAIPVLIFNPVQDEYMRNAHRQQDGEEANPIDDEKRSVYETKLDKSLSGRYYVAGVKYLYDALDPRYKFKTELILSKVNWDTQNDI